jgi:hypothetical protein
MINGQIAGPRSLYVCVFELAKTDIPFPLFGQTRPDKNICARSIHRISAVRQHVLDEKTGAGVEQRYT